MNHKWQLLAPMFVALTVLSASGCGGGTSSSDAKLTADYKSKQAPVPPWLKNGGTAPKMGGPPSSATPAQGK